MFNYRIKTLIFFIITTVILGSHYLRFTYDWYNKKQEYYKLIERVNATPFNLLEQDLSKIFNLMNLFEAQQTEFGEKQTENYLARKIVQLNLIKNFVIKDSDNELREQMLTFRIFKDILEITREKITTSIDLQSLKTLIQNLIPEYITYNIYLNNQLIISNGDLSYLKITQESKLNTSDILVRKISIKLSFLKQERWKLFLDSSIDYATIIISCIFISLFLYRKINHRLRKKLQRLDEDFNDLKKYNELLNNKVIREKEYILSMIQKINNQAKNELLVKLTGEENKSSTNFIIFPIAIIDDTKSIINIKKLLADLVEFFKYDLEQKKIELNINSKIDNIEINASEESLYQIIFSLVFNVLNLIPDHTNLAINVINDEIFKFTLEYNGFNLSEEQMRNYSSRYPKEVFLLNLNQVFDHLKLYKFTYSITRNTANNTIRLEICSNRTIEKEDKDKIFKLKDYIKK